MSLESGNKYHIHIEDFSCSSSIFNYKPICQKARTKIETMFLLGLSNY